MNSVEIKSHTSCTSFSNHDPTEEHCDEKTVLLSPKGHLNASSGTIDTPTEPLQLQRQATIPKAVQLDLKQQFVTKLKVDTGKSKSDHHPIKPVRSVTPGRNTINDENFHRTNSNRSNDTGSTTITASTTSSSISAATTIIKKKVRFAADKRGRVQCEIFRNMNPKSKQESLDCFYQMNDFHQFRRECKQEAIMQQKTSTYRDNFAAVYAACTTGNFKTVTRERAYISAASCRGLEVVVFPTLHRDRKNTIATILKTQASLPSTMTDYSERAETIAAASRYLSKQSRQLARVFGSGDAAVVIANQRIETIQQQQQQQQQKPHSKHAPACSQSDNLSSNDTLPQIKQPRRESNSNVVVPHCFVTC